MNVYMYVYYIVYIYILKEVYICTHTHTHKHPQVRECEQLAASLAQFLTTSPPQYMSISISIYLNLYIGFGSALSEVKLPIVLT